MGSTCHMDSEGQGRVTPPACRITRSNHERGRGGCHNTRPSKACLDDRIERLWGNGIDQNQSRYPIGTQSS